MNQVSNKITELLTGQLVHWFFLNNNFNNATFGE